MFAKDSPNFIYSHVKKCLTRNKEVVSNKAKSLSDRCTKVSIRFSYA